MNSQPQPDQLDDDEPYREIIPTEEFIERIDEADTDQEEKKTLRPETGQSVLTSTGFTEQPPG